MGLTAPPSLSNTLPAMPAVSLAWMGLLSPHCPCHHQSHPDPLTPPNPKWGNAITAPPAHPMTHPSTFVPPMRCATVASASPTCPHTMRTRHWLCRFQPSAAPCWGRPNEAGPLIFTPTPEPSAPRFNHFKKKKQNKKQQHPNPQRHSSPHLHTHSPASPLTDHNDNFDTRAPIVRICLMMAHWLWRLHLFESVVMLGFKQSLTSHCWSVW